MSGRAGRRRSALVAVLALVVGTVGGLIAGLPGPTLGTRTTGDAALAADVRAAFTTERGFVSLSAARVRDGTVGFAGLGDAGAGPPGPDTPYELGSITKTFTAALLADAVERGEVGLDDPVSTWLPELADTGAGTSTLRELATHTAGLPPFPTSAAPGVALRVVGNTNPYRGSVSELLTATRTTAVTARGSYRYSNLGVALLGHALARAGHAPDWATLLRQRILDPLGMDRTVVVDRAGQVPPGTARPHHDNGWPAPFWSGPAFAPAGSSTVTTARDLATWAGALLDGSAPGTRALEPLVDIPGGRIGLVWHVLDVDGRAITWHNGGTGGTRTILALDRARGQAVLLLANSARDADTAGRRLAATGPGAGVPAVDRPEIGWLGVLGWNVVAVWMLGTAVVRWRGGRGWPLVDGALAAAAGLLVLLVHGPWQLVPTAVLPGLALALLALGARTARAPRSTDVGRPRSRTSMIASVATSVVVLALVLWTL